jgi:hypothetical protein
VPNYHYNKLTIIDLKGGIPAILERVKSDDTVFSAHKIKPMPEPLNIGAGTVSDIALKIAKGEDISEYFEGHRVDSDEAMLAYYASSGVDLRALGAIQLENIKQYGAPHWYDWVYENWGTKWIWDAEIVDQSPTKAVINFTTAWCSPGPLIKTLSGLCPDAVFHVLHWCSFGDGGTNGVYVFKNGEMIDRWCETRYPEESLQPLFQPYPDFLTQHLQLTLPQLTKRRFEQVAKRIEELADTIRSATTSSTVVEHGKSSQDFEALRDRPKVEQMLGKIAQLETSVAGIVSELDFENVLIDRDDPRYVAKWKQQEETQGEKTQEEFQIPNDDEFPF